MRLEAAERVGKAHDAVNDEKDAEEEGKEPLHRARTEEKKEPEEKERDGDEGGSTVKKCVACQMRDQP